MASAEVDSTLYTHVWFRGSSFGELCESAAAWLREHEDEVTVVNALTSITDDVGASFELAVLYAPRLDLVGCCAGPDPRLTVSIPDAARFAGGWKVAVTMIVGCAALIGSLFMLMLTLGLMILHPLEGLLSLAVLALLFVPWLYRNNARANAAWEANLGAWEAYGRRAIEFERRNPHARRTPRGSS